MKFRFPTTTLLLLVLAMFTACQTSTKENTEPEEQTTDSNASEIVEKIEEVVYEGTLPCPDCDHRAVTLSLKTKEPVFQMETIYVGKSDSVYVQDGQFETRRGYELDEEAQVIIINPNAPDERQVFLQSSDTPNKLIQLGDNLERLRTELPNELIRKAEGDMEETSK